MTDTEIIREAVSELFRLAFWRAKETKPGHATDITALNLGQANELFTKSFEANGKTICIGAYYEDAELPHYSPRDEDDRF